ncbi:MAG: PilZ domain-containing protein [Myxococcota bacterium]
MLPPEPQFPRRSLRVPQRVETLSSAWTGGRFFGYVSDISEGGAFIQSSNPREVGSFFSLRLQLPKAPEMGLCCRGEVIWTRGYAGVDGPCPGMGVRFVEVIGHESQRFLARFCAESDPGDPPRRDPRPLEP